MELVDSRRNKLDYARIMHVYHENEAQDGKLGKFEYWLTAMAATIQTLNPDCVIIGNTFFMAKIGSGEDSHRAMIWAINADTANNLVDNLVEEFHRLMNKGVTDFMAIYSSPAISRALRQAFAKVKEDGDSFEVTKLNDGKKLMRLRLGAED